MTKHKLIWYEMIDIHSTIYTCFLKARKRLKADFVAEDLKEICT